MPRSRESSSSPPAKQKCRPKPKHKSPPKAKKTPRAPVPGSSSDIEVNNKVDETSSDESDNTFSGRPNSEPMDVSIQEDEFGGFKFGDIHIPAAPPPACISANNDGPRLIITHIENIDFKSYAGKQVLGPFHKSFTSIIGPNGSGKSNVIDSMLFVFGYRAAKIRSKKLSVLLHKSEQRQHVKSCTVTVHFHEIIDKPGEDFEVVPNSNFCISRTAHQDSSSFYTLNNRRVHFKEVSKLLLGHGIDLDHNRFLILQGEVEQISMMKPMAATEHECGMLEYLEDIIGTTRYKTPLEILFGRVEKLTEERSDKIERVKIAEKEKDSLEGPKNEAIEYLKTENEKTAINNFTIQKYIKEQKPLIEEKRKRKKEIEEEMKAVKEQMKQIVDERDEVNKKAKEGSKLLESIVQEKDKVKVAFEKISSDDLIIQADVVQVSRKRKKTKEMVGLERKKLLELQSVPEKNACGIKELEDRLQTLVKEREKAEATRDELMEGIATETKGLQEGKEKLETKLVDLKKTVDETNSANCIAKKELDIYLQDEQRQRTKLEQIRANHAKASDIVEKSRGEIEELERKIPEAEAELRGASEELRRVSEESARVEGQVREQRGKVEETKSSMQATRSKGKVLDFLMDQKARGSLPGIYGRLGDLGAIEAKYDVAVSTACGPLDSIVVDTKETGEKCIELLRKHDVGRVNIIILDKQEHLRSKCEAKNKYPEDVPRLFDLIRVVDKSISTAFYYAVRETLVAADMHQATRIAYGATRYRVVCLTGEMVETSGTMSGGGRPSRGRMGQSLAPTNVATPGQVEKMSRQLEELETRSRHLRDRHDALRPIVSQLPQRIKKMQMDLKKLTAEIRSAAENEPLLREQIRKQEERLEAAAPDKKEVQRMEAVIAKTQAAFDAASEAADKVSAEVQKLHKQIVDKAGGRMASAQKGLDEITKNIDKVRKEKTKLAVAITTSKRDLKKSMEKIANMDQEITDSEVALTDMQAQIAHITVRGRELMDQIATYSTQILEQEEVVTVLRERVREIGEREREKKAAKLEVDHALETVNAIVHEYEGRMRTQTRRLEALKMQRIPGEEAAPELKVYEPEELNAETAEEMQYKLTLCEQKLSTKKPNFGAIEEFCEREAVYMRRVKELEELTGQRNEMRAVVEDLRKRRLDEFMLGFNIITEKLKEMYQMITLGGDAELELVDSLDPFREGIIFSVRPPKKSWKNISNLSGGEKTLSSLALVFALHYYKPSPLYVMDEIDAALDFKNVSIVGNYIKERTKNAQFIIISLRANMFELADRLVGIYKTHNATKSCTINPKRYGRQAVKPRVAGESAREGEGDVVEDKGVPVPTSVLIESVSRGEIPTLDVVGVLAEKPHVNN